MHAGLAMDVGTTLRVARERRGLSIAQLSSTTKIPATAVRAIEDNDFDKVPRGIFVRGFIRAYAREVELDPEETVAQFLAETGETIPAAEATGADAIDDEIGHVQIDPDLSESRPGWGYALIVAALIVGVVSFNRSSTSDARPAFASVEPPAASPASDPAAPETGAVATAGAVLRVEMEARGVCWVKAVVDGRTVVARLLQPGERIATDAQHDVVLRVGDPAAFSYSINGRPGQPLGAAGTPVTVRFTSDGRQDALAS